MAESPHDDLADALARMAEGDFEPVQPEEPPPQPVRPAPVRAVKPANARPAAQPAVQPARPTQGVAPAGSPASRPVAPPRVRPAAPTLGSATVPSEPAPAPAPSAPLAVPPSARKLRPSAPTVRSAVVPTEPTETEVAGDQSTALSGEVIEDDESAMVVPYMSAPTKPSNAVAEARAKAARQKNLNFRKTLIPILLTSGVILIGFASLKFMAGSDSMLTDMPIWIPVILLLLAAMFLSLAAVNMLSVKNFKP